jgi:rfaE bifunctional protein kinase chain/domain
MRSDELARRLSEATVVVLGDLVADEYVYGETDRVSREAPVPVVRWESAETKLGGAANAAANVAALGARVRPVGVLGQDAAGREILRQFREIGAEPRGLVLLAGRATETKTRLLAGGRSTTRQQLLRLDRCDETPLTDSQRRRVAAKLRAAVKGAGALVVSDYGSGLLDETLVAEVRGLARTLPVCVDSRYAVRAYRGVTLVKPNEPELEVAAGTRLRTPDEVAQAGRTLLADLEAKALVVTHGRRGMSLFQADGRTVTIPVWGPGEAVDVTGAGDTVLAVLASSLAVGASFEDAARLANVAAGIVVQKPGTATCSRAELVTALGAPTGSRAVPRSRAASRARR